LPPGRVYILDTRIDEKLIKKHHQRILKRLRLRTGRLCIVSSAGRYLKFLPRYVSSKSIAILDTIAILITIYQGRREGGHVPPPENPVLKKSVFSVNPSVQLLLVCVYVDGTTSDSFLTSSGVHQGCILAPALFCRAIDWIMCVTVQALLSPNFYLRYPFRSFPLCLSYRVLRPLFNTENRVSIGSEFAEI